MLPRIGRLRFSSALHGPSPLPGRASVASLLSCAHSPVFDCVSGTVSASVRWHASDSSGFDKSTRVYAPAPNDLSAFDVFGDGGYLHLVHGYNSRAFQVGDVCLVGSIVLFKDAYFMWAPTSVEEITEASLAVVTLHHPTPNLVLVGTGAYARPLPPAVLDAYASRGITLDVRATEDAVATFNFLLQEDRHVALCTLPAGA